jgi:hypothetical protein
MNSHWKNRPHDYAILLENGKLYGGYGRATTWDQRKDALYCLKAQNSWGQLEGAKVIKVYTKFERV